MDKFWIVIILSSIGPVLGLCFLTWGILAISKKSSSVGGLFCLAIGAVQAVLLLEIYVSSLIFTGKKIIHYPNPHDPPDLYGWACHILLVLVYILPFILMFRNRIRHLRQYSNAVRKLGRCPSFGLYPPYQSSLAPPHQISEASNKLKGKDRIFEVDVTETPKMAISNIRPMAADSKSQIEKKLLIKKISFFLGFLILFSVGSLITFIGVLINTWTFMGFCDFHGNCAPI